MNQSFMAGFGNLGLWVRPWAITYDLAVLNEGLRQFKVWNQNEYPPDCSGSCTKDIHAQKQAALPAS